MGTVAEKLSYLADTKDLFKDRLNSLGAEITSSTAFRNYLTWLDTFYGEVSDKTNLSQNGIVGRTSQESTRGINVYNVHNAYNVTSGASIGDNDYITGTFDNTSDTSDKYLNIWCSKTDMLQTSTNYLLVCEIKSVSGTGQLYPWTKHTASAIDTQHPTNISFSSLSAGQILTYNVTTKSSFDGTSNDLRTLVRFNAGQSGSITFRLSLLTDTSITSDTFVYEPFTFGASPNPSYEQSINNLSGNVPYKVSGKNLFNPTYEVETQYDINGNVLSTNKYFLNNDIISINKSNNSYGNTFFNKIYLSTGTYTFSCNVSQADNTTSQARLKIQDWTNSSRIVASKSVNISSGKVEQTFEVSSNAEIGIMLIPNQNSDGTLYLSNIQLEENSTTTDFEPYISQTFNIPLKSKNLFDKNTINKLNGYFERSGDTIHSSGANRVFYLECKPNTTYAFTQGETNISNHVFQVASTVEKPDIDVVVENFADRSSYNPYKTFTYTTNVNAKYLVIRLRSGDTTNEFLDGVQIEENNEATSYEPYYDIELCNINTHEDEIYSSNGKFYLEKNISKVILNGSEEWTTIQAYTRNYYAVDISNLLISDSGSNDALLYNNYYIGYKSNEIVGNNTKDYGICRRNNNSQVLFRDKDHSTLSSLTSWLSTHNNIMYYPLATPTTTEITQENYPSLYNALKQIQDYLTAYKINKEFILGYSSPEIEY